MAKKKVGIVTFHTADNYGAVLQAFALQNFISKNSDYDVRIIDFNTPSHEAEHCVIKKKRSVLRTIFYGALNMLFYFPLKSRINKFASFRNNYLRLTSKKYNSIDVFLNNMEEFDYYISGSDQVFNPKVKFKECYYLGFNKRKGLKIAYAPSFGLSIFTPEEQTFIRSMVSDFDYLSCREKNGAEFLSQLTNLPVPIVCDPVFLLTKKEWESIAEIKSFDKPFIFVYDLNGGKNLIDLAHKISRLNGNMQIICMTTRTDLFYRGVSVVRNLGPCELLSYIKASSYVVTDSFHGTSLSLILQKRVVSYIAALTTSSRVISLLSSLHIEDQLVYSLDKFDWNSIKFNNYTNFLNDYVKKSINYLNTALSIK